MNKRAEVRSAAGRAGGIRLLDAVHGQPAVQEGAAAAGARRGHVLLDAPTAARSSTARPGLWCVNAGHCRPKIVAAVQKQVARDGLRADLPAWATRSRSSSPSAWPSIAPGRLLAGVLHQLRLRVGRHRAQDRARLPPRARRGPALPPDRPRARLPRRQLRRHGGRRHPGQPQGLRPGRGRASTTSATPTTWRETRSRRASRRTAPSSPTTWSACARCTIPRPSPR